MLKNGFFLSALLLMLSSSSAIAENEALIFSDNFSESSGAGWNLESGWAIDGGKLTGSGHVWISTLDNFNQEQLRVSFTLNLMQGGLHFNLRNSGSVGRYFIGFNAGGPAVLNKQYFPDTFMSGLISGNTILENGQEYAVEFLLNNETISLTIDGELEWQYRDDSPLLTGDLSFESLLTEPVSVDDFMVYAPEEDPGAPWVATGGPAGGLGYDVRIHPDEPEKMFVTDANAGVFVSHDSGESWQSSNEGITARTGTTNDLIPVFCLSIDPNQPATLWVGTAGVRGIFKSTDSGQSWERKDTGIVENTGITFRGLAVKPGDSDTVFAAAEIGSWVWAGEDRRGREFDMTQGVVYKTSDGGESWRPVWRGNNLARYILIDPVNPDTIYVSTGIFDREAADAVPAQWLGGGEGVIKSVDGGESWGPANQGLNNLYVGSLYMHPNDPQNLLAGTGNNQYYQNAGIYQTTDGGDHWQQVLSGEIITSVEYSETNPDVAYAGSSEAIFRSLNGGTNWSLMGERGWGPDGIRAGFPIDFQLDPENSDRLFINNYGGGNFLTTDGGLSWINASRGYTGAQVRDLSINPQSNGQLFVAARSGLFKTDDGGANWLGLNNRPVNVLEWNLVQFDPGDPQHLLASNNWNSVIYRSIDSGRSWSATTGSQLSSVIQSGGNRGWRALAFAPSDRQLLYAGSSAYLSAGTFDDSLAASGIYRSDSGGSHWGEANDALSADANVAAIAVDYSNPDRLFVASSNRGLLRSTDKGDSWQLLSGALPNGEAALSVAIHPDDPQTIFTGLIRGGLYLSVDGGSSWSSISSGLIAESSITEILFDPNNSSALYIADKESGVYYSSDGGAHWQLLTNQLTNKAVNAMALSHDGAHLYAATEGGGVFRLDVVGELPDSVAQISAPTVNVVVTGMDVEVTWSVVDSASGYSLYYAPYPYEGAHTIRSIDMNEANRLSVTLYPNASFYVAVKAYHSHGSSEFSNVEWLQVE
ncbi:MAG: hypothetical protein HN842_09370 [Gammaproteobacteria bacterium]|nr:hypothetical protein [Gammaproteobacteria bacterium]